MHRHILLRWVARDPAFRVRYEQARRVAHQRLYDELPDEILRARGLRPAAYAARRLMRRAPKKHGRLPPEQRPRLLHRQRPRRSDGT